MGRLVLSLLTFCALALSAAAQVRVEFKIPRRLYMAYEPILARVTLTNLAGRDLMLADTQQQQWFLFEVRSAEDSVVGPRNAKYEVPPLLLPAGQSVSRMINLTSLYPVDEFGGYRIRASVYVADLDRYFTSRPDYVEIAEGRPVWEQTVGVPNDTGGPGGTRVITFLQFRQPKDNMLYIRIRDQENGIIRCTYPIGRLIANNEPAIQLDRDNQVHVLQVIAPKTYIYSRIGANGEWVGQQTFTEAKTRPHLARTKAGDVTIKGGQEVLAAAAPATPQLVPKVSDRPVGMPKTE